MQWQRNLSILNAKIQSCFKTVTLKRPLTRLCQIISQSQVQNELQDNTISTVFKSGTTLRSLLTKTKIGNYYKSLISNSKRKLLAKVEIVLWSRDSWKKEQECIGLRTTAFVRDYLHPLSFPKYGHPVLGVYLYFSMESP